MTMRIMGLDYGSKTVGVAVSDPLGITAQGVETICRKDENKLRKTCARIEALIEEPVYSLASLHSSCEPSMAVTLQPCSRKYFVSRPEPQP